MICGCFMCYDLIVLFFVDPGKQDKADGTEEDKADELAEPEEPAEGLSVGLAGYVVELHCLLDEVGIDADAAGGDDHGDAAHGEYGQRVDDGEVTGGADGEEAHPGAEEIEAPDADGIDEEKRFVADVFDADEAMEDIEDDGADLADGGDVLESFEGPAAGEEDEDGHGDAADDPDPGYLSVRTAEQEV